MNTTHKTMQQKAAEAHNACRLKGDSMLDNNIAVLRLMPFTTARHKHVRH